MVWKARRHIWVAAKDPRPISRALVILLLGSVLAWGLLYAAGSMPYGLQRKVVELEVTRGESFSQVARKLREHGVIASTTLFTVLARVQRVDRNLGWGHYRFELPVSAREVLSQMELGRGAFHRVTIPEGLTVREIAELMAERGLIDKDSFLAQVADPETLSSLGLDGTGAEGYLFPDTYHFPTVSSELDILSSIVGRFQRVFTEEMEARTRELGFTRHEVLTLASLIEKEARMESERALVSAVFHNRLKRKMPLQSDPTAIYGLADFSGYITRKHLRAETPHNTYIIRGLPPSPICNPGFSSIEAALYPADVPYLYFVSKNDGSHFFSATLEEHNRAVKIYRRNPARPFDDPDHQASATAERRASDKGTHRGLTPAARTVNRARRSP